MTAGPPGDPVPDRQDTDEQIARESDRVAGRLRVLGPRWAQRDMPADARHVTRVREALQQLADLAADTRGEPHRQVPSLRWHALGDQVLVLAQEAAAAGCGARARDILIDLRRALP